MIVDYIMDVLGHGDDKLVGSTRWLTWELASQVDWRIDIWSISQQIKWDYYYLIIMIVTTIFANSSYYV